MLPTFVIGLREGLEAALVVGIIAAFLRAQGRRDLVRWVLFGVGLAVALCAGAGVALDLYARTLPQRQQEGLETVVAALAVGMVTYMIVWMRRHSRGLKGRLEGLAAGALTATPRAGLALIVMAFLAVIREGLETVVFLLAAFAEPGSSAGAGLGAVLGLAVAVGLGYGIYRGAVRLDLSRFFRVTGLVLVLVAAGLVVNALHTAHEAGWLDAGQGRTLDLSWLVQPGTVRASLLTGMLGLQPHPVALEVAGWLAYLVPLGLYVAWPPGRALPARPAIRALAAWAVLGAAVAAGALGAAPAPPEVRPTTAGGGFSATVTDRTAASATVGTQTAGAGLQSYRLAAAGAGTHAGARAERYSATVETARAPAVLDAARVAELNGGRLPLGTRPQSQVPVTYRRAATLTVWLAPGTDRVLDLRRQVRTDVLAAGEPLARPLRTEVTGLPAATVAAAVAQARADRTDAARRSDLRALAAWAGGSAAFAALAAAGFGVATLRRRRAAATAIAAAVALAACSTSGGGETAQPGGRAGGAATAVRVAVVTVTARDGCTSDRTSFPAGAITFRIKNQDAAAVSEVELLSGERILGEKENLPPGFSGAFTVRLTAGRYDLYCPGATPEKRRLTVTGTAPATGDTTVAVLLRQATTGYADYVDAQVDQLAAAVRRLDAALHGTDLAAAQRAYIAARPYYERIEPVAESFVVGTDSLDADIDVREGDVPAARWRGFHRIEKALFAQRSLRGAATYGTRLVTDIARLERLTAGLSYQPAELANGAVGLLDEVAASKITGEEERYSRVDLVDLANNVEGSEQAFAQLRPALGRIDAALALQIGDRFAALDALVARHRSPGDPSGYVRYPQLTTADKRSLTAAVKAVQEPLSKVASKLADA